ncbi:hypothetical protein ABI_30530 [Asticcacaulis biprosthecium C19]|uniref:3-keto-alpha-glucoside-1,2-lyase/3-keto-2-hydroxy-glucal hydratase domain-containing protein n=1 Tax=Asticcacaulis biprosthecium C19 TaxID=715226 RepID=F4QN45_9CAUL|nr:DUF1080 domain-containing protein [Asticcacaulis biprosthecium]EGF91636.1 hypothetical protein ABI_30530 [Asticcacaulis biprosthecium C19]
MNRRSLLLAATAVAVSSLPLAACAGTPKPNTLTEAEKTAGWELLFNGKDTSGWRRFKGGASGWVVEDGALALKAAGGGDIVTEQEFGDFELSIDWKISPKGNSGIMYFVRELPDTDRPYHTGPEAQVLDNAGHPDGKIPSHTAGALYDLIVPPSDASKPIGEWNTARIVVAKNHIEHWLNGVKVADTSYGDDAWKALIAKSKFAAMPHFAEVPTGRICLQDHGDPVWFRNIKIRKL